jgi:hypothetical protein
VITITGWNDIEGNGMIQYVIVQGEITTGVIESRMQLQNKRDSPGDEVDTPLLEGNPVGPFDDGSCLVELFSSDFACPIGLNSFFYFAIGA